MNKKSLSEASIISKYIMPSIEDAGWDRQKQIAQEISFTDGRIIVRKKIVTRGTRKRADVIIYYKNNLPLAIIEAKDNNHSTDAGMQQGLGYGETLDIHFVYSSNGDGFIEHDRTKSEGQVERELKLDKFPSPEELWSRYKTWKGITEEQEKVVTHNYYYDQDCYPPRYYQRIAINRSIEAITQGQDKTLLVMATGTGKTLTAFQIVYKLFKSGAKKRVLYLADRNILIDQIIIGDFKPLLDNLNKIKNRTADKSREIQFALYQSLTGETEEKKLFKKYSKDYFDLIIIDECRRGSAKDDSAWREILDHFDSATKIGLTATPKETKVVSNSDYFGDAIFTYSLKQGIEDGFLAPYKVIRVAMDRDAEGYRPEKGKRDKYGEELEDRIYNRKDFDRTLVLENRTEVVAKYVSDYLKKNNKRMAKSIFFCVDIDHANRMRRALANENADLVAENHKYVMKITGDDEEGIFLEDLEDKVGCDMDTFDLICHIAYDMPALTRKERANNVKKRNYFGKYSEKARIVLEKLLDKYSNEGIENIEDIKVLKLPDFHEIGSQLEIVKKVFGGKKEYEKAVKELVRELYTIA